MPVWKISILTDIYSINNNFSNKLTCVLFTVGRKQCYMTNQ